MNLMLLPQGDADWTALAPGHELVQQFPSGRYRYIGGDEAGVGRYQMCLLFSPLLQLTAMDTAVAVAEAALQALLATPNPSQLRKVSRRQLLRGQFRAVEQHTD